MKRCRACGNPDCPGCGFQNAPQTASENPFGILSVFPTTALERPPESVWVSAHLDYFRAVSSRFPFDIGFLGLDFPPDGAYRRLDGFYFAWLRAKVERLDGAAKSDGRRQLRDIATEAISAGVFPESFADIGQWPRIAPAGYEPPVLERSDRIFPICVADFLC